MPEVAAVPGFVAEHEWAANFLCDRHFSLTTGEEHLPTATRSAIPIHAWQIQCFQIVEVLAFISSLIQLDSSKDI
jgi:hypothetical protein